MTMLLLMAAACAVDDPLQGATYLPDGAIPLGDPNAIDPRRGDGGLLDAADAAPPVVVFPDGSAGPINTCETARPFGTIAGDKAPAFITTTGSCSEWLSIRATEDDSSAIGAGMRVLFTLSMVGADYELYAFLDKDRDLRQCNAPTASSFKPGTQQESVELTWGEGSVANGSDDGRTIGVAVVRAGTGPCNDAGTFTLRAEH
jgi:hypothetical protein